MGSLLELEFAAVMAPANQTWWWYTGVTGDQVGQLLTQNKAMLTSINAYLDTDNSIKLAVVMQPATEQWWWWVGITAGQLNQYLTKNKAQITDISAYIDTDRQLKFAVIMRPGTGTGWWYGHTGAEVGQQLTQSKSRLATISAYIDLDNSLKFVFAAVPADLTQWWYFGQTAEQVGQLLTLNKAMLTDFGAYVDTDNTVRFVVTMAPANQTWWWGYGDPAHIGQLLSRNKARLTMVSPAAVPPPEISWQNFGTGSGTTSGGATECAYTLNLTLRLDGTCRFWGAYTNRGDVPIITAPSQTFGVSIVVDANGKKYSFSAGGQVPSAPQVGSTYTWDQTTKSAAIADNWRAIAARNYANYGYHNEASLSSILSEIASAVANAAQEVGALHGSVEAIIALVGG